MEDHETNTNIRDLIYKHRWI